MAFVYRNQKSIKESTSPGPGAYQNERQSENKNNVVSFNNKQNRQLWEIKETPGPGDYELLNSLTKNKVLVDDADQNFMILEAQQPSAFFKSKSKRGTYQSSPKTPGPGKYEVNSEQKQQVLQKTNKPTKLMKYLYYQNTKKMAPSIPEECCWKDEDVNEQKNEKNKTKSKGNKKSTPFASKVERNIIQRPKTSVGPGSYNISSGFKNKKSNNNSSLYLKKNEKQNDNSKEVILGPGSYDIKSQNFTNKKNSYSKGIPCFGSMETRFYKPNINRNSSLGPASYAQSNSKQNENNYRKKKTIPFNSSSQKKFTLIKSTNKYVSPFTYNPQIKVKKVGLYKEGKQNFGSNAPRFQERKVSVIEDSPLAKNEENLKEVFKKYEGVQKKLKSNIRSIPKQRKQNQIDNRPLCYDSDFRTLTKKYSAKEQINAPFYTCQERFITSKDQKNIIEQIGEMRKIKIQNTRKKSGRMKKKSHSNSVLKMYISQIRKRKQKDKDNLCIMNLQNGGQSDPQGSYNPSPNIKKSFNKLFADTILI